MSKNVAMFIDVANLYYAARGQDVDVDYVALLKHATKGRDLIRAYAYSGLDPENENQRKFIDFLGKNGYKTLTKDIRKFGDGRVKANLDIELVVDLFRLADRMDIAVIVSGDGDFAPAIRALQDKGIRCEVISFKPNTSSDLIAVADEFIDIMKIAGIGRKRGEGSRAEAMAMPEMPAKEVVPEFGFREASPSVAAAALAALRSGNGGGERRRGGGSERSAAERGGSDRASATATEDGRRRRRRRGGRGRGRGRDGAEAESPAAAGTRGGDEPWEELDDLAEIDGALEEREYSFSEADEETLRELGLLDQGSAATAGDATEAEAEAEEAEAKPKRATRSRRTTAKKPATDEAADAADDGEEKPKRRRSTRSKTTATKSAKASGDEGADAGAAKPTRRRTTKAKADAAGDEKPKRARGSRSRAASDDGAQASGEGGGSADEGQPQGIWGRFRSARRDG